MDHYDRGGGNTKCFELPEPGCNGKRREQNCETPGGNKQSDARGNDDNLERKGLSGDYGTKQKLIKTNDMSHIYVRKFLSMEEHELELKLRGEIRELKEKAKDGKVEWKENVWDLKEGKLMIENRRIVYKKNKA